MLLVGIATIRSDGANINAVIGTYFHCTQTIFLVKYVIDNETLVVRDALSYIEYFTIG